MSSAEERETPRVDAIVIGAGPAGIYSIYRLREAGFSVHAYEGGSGVGGTWYWCRYPGARFDSESVTYCYSFSDELLSEWRWRDCFAGQPESERYFNHVVDRFDLRRHIQFDSWVRSARWDSDRAEWEVRLDDGSTARARFVLTSVGVLSADYIPDFEGIADFEGDWCHTGRWPDGFPVDGRRVGVVGTGASAVQLIPEIANRVEELWVFQRTANYCVPLRNRELLEEEHAWLAENYRRVFELCSESSNNHIHRYDPRPVAAFSPEQRLEVFEELWEEAGFKKWLAGFPEMIQPGPINEEYSAFIRDRIRARVHDPAVAELLVPSSHSFSSKRPPCETGYYEAFNLPNVHLVDLRAAPITRITRTGVETVAASYDLDSLVFATGFDFITGSLDRIEFVGEGGQTLKEHYADGVRHFLGLQSAGFPNLFTINAASSGNYLRGVEPVIDWVAAALVHLRDHGLSSMAPSDEAEESWSEHLRDAGSRMLRAQADSYFVGANIPGKPRVYLISPETAPEMRARRREIAERGYREFVLS